MKPLLLLISPDETHIFDRYLDEILLIEGYNCREVMESATPSPAELGQYAVAIISSGAAARIEPERVVEYVSAGGHSVIIRPPLAWLEHFGLKARGETYAILRDGYIHADDTDPWIGGLPALDLQVPGECDVHENVSADALAVLAGQRGLCTGFPAVAKCEVGAGRAVVFCYDLVDVIVQLHQGRIEHASNGPDPDYDRDGKFTAGDLFGGMRDFELRNVPQADVHQDLLVRIIRGLTGRCAPIPRLWHFPMAAPGMVLLDGDGDGMVWGDLEWTVQTCAKYGARFSFFLMDQQIEAFSSEALDEVRAMGHSFGPHPWVSLRPTVDEWQQCVTDIVGRMREKCGSAGRALRSHSVIFPGWDESPKLFAEHGLRLDTNFMAGYRYQSGHCNSSALPVKFVDRDGQIVDCYEQSTIHGDDTLSTTKTMLPPHDEPGCIDLALAALREVVTRYHGVFHPYFHPIALGGRGQVPTARWFEEVLTLAGELDLDAPSADEWIDFNDARRAVEIADPQWDADAAALRFILSAPLAVDGLTLLLPSCTEMCPVSVEVDGEPIASIEVGFEELTWTAAVLSLSAGESREFLIEYG